VKSPIILALDTADPDLARAWIECTREYVGVYKIGLEFYLRHGKKGIHQIMGESDIPIFLDLKLHDIPNTVKNAVNSVSDLHPTFLTVHASGGREMITAASSADPQIAITAVTVLTSLTAIDTDEIGFREGPLPTAVHLARLSVAAGARAIVSSPFEVSEIRAAVPSSITLITPGVRPEGSSRGDQKRVMTPRAALDHGADYVVIGRPITEKWSESAQAMTDAAKSIFESLQ
jgi:orotidine-5'-phosphate decarboxylase